MPGGELAPIGGIFLFDGAVNRLAQRILPGGGQALPRGQVHDGRPKGLVGACLIGALLRRFDHAPRLNRRHLAPTRPQGDGAVVIRRPAIQLRAVGKGGERVAPDPVYPACPHINRQIGPKPAGPDPAPDAVARLEHRHSRPGIRQRPCRRQPRHPRADRRDALGLGMGCTAPDQGDQRCHQQVTAAQCHLRSTTGCPAPAPCLASRVRGKAWCCNGCDSISRNGWARQSRRPAPR